MPQSKTLIFKKTLKKISTSEHEYKPFQGLTLVTFITFLYVKGITAV